MKQNRNSRKSKNIDKKSNEIFREYKMILNHLKYLDINE